MNDDQVDLVQSSFSKVVPIADTAASLFYARLFEIAPEVKPFFKGDMSEQGKKLMQTIGIVVNGLKAPQSVLPAARALAIKHVDYGVRPEHYAVVGAALLWTLQQGLADAFTDDVESAWTAAYTLLSDVMVEAAYPQASA